MTLLILYLVIAIGVSFYCSLLEASFLSLTPAYVHLYESEHPKIGKNLARLKEDPDRPLAAVLSLNTIAHTIGATGVGAQAAVLFGSYWTGLVSALLTLAILIFSEVIPKTLGTVYWRALTGFVASSLPVLIVLTYPLVWLSEKISGLLRDGKPILVARDEISAFAELGAKEGAISNEESAFIQSMLKFRDIEVASVMTPLENVRSVDQDMHIDEVLELDIPFSRIPVTAGSESHIIGYLLKDDLHDVVLEETGDQPVKTLLRKIIVVREHEILPRAMKRFGRINGHIASAVNEDGEATGILTLEDVVESLIGLEIVDEFDRAVDMRAENAGVAPV